MLSFKDILEENGKKGVELLKESITVNNRVATGKTRDSVRNEATDDTLTIYGASHIDRLEKGATAEDIRREGDIFDQIKEWTFARGLGDSAVAGRIYDSLLENGWSTDSSLGNRTGQNGGTENILSKPINQIIENTKKDVQKASKNRILMGIKSSLNGVNNN